MTNTPAEAALSVPKPFRAPRPLTPTEMTSLRTVADQLIPAAGENPAATAEPGLDEALLTAINARADAFDDIVEILARLEGASPGEVDSALRLLHRDSPDTFQPLSAVVAGAWLLLPAVRQRIGYPGQHRDPAPLELAVDEISSGILDAVIERGPIFRPAPAERSDAVDGVRLP